MNNDKLTQDVQNQLNRPLTDKEREFLLWICEKHEVEK